MKIRPFHLALCALTCFSLGSQAETPAKKASAALKGKSAATTQAHDYVRFVGDDVRGKLETVVVSMQNDAGVKVDLIGAIHIADGAYYKALSQLFTSYEELLFELVDGQTLKQKIEGKPAAAPKGKAKAKPADDDDDEEDAPGEKKAKPGPAFAILKAMMQGMGKFLRLEYQTSAIDYHTKNFVHADVSMAEFLRLQAEKGESFFTIFQKAMMSQLSKGGGGKDQEPTGGQLLLALLGDSSGVKIAMARMLGQVETIGEDVGLGADSVILGERNRVALETFDREVKAGHKNLGIFYGAAHLSDMESRLEKRGYKRTGERWFTAWDIKPLTDEKKEKAETPVVPPPAPPKP